MSDEFEPRVRALLEKPYLANVATVDRSGAPRVNPTWFSVDGGTICLNSNEGRAWPKRLRREARIAVSIVNADEPTEYVEITGRVIEDTHDGADAHIDLLAHKYLGIDYPNRFEGEERILFRIRPERVVYVNVAEEVPNAPEDLVAWRQEDLHERRLGETSSAPLGGHREKR